MNKVIRSVSMIVMLSIACCADVENYVEPNIPASEMATILIKQKKSNFLILKFQAMWIIGMDGKTCKEKMLHVASGEHKVGISFVESKGAGFGGGTVNVVLPLNAVSGKYYAITEKTKGQDAFFEINEITLEEASPLLKKYEVKE